MTLSCDASMRSGKRLLGGGMQLLGKLYVKNGQLQSFSMWEWLEMWPNL